MLQVSACDRSPSLLLLALALACDGAPGSKASAGGAGRDGTGGDAGHGGAGAGGTASEARPAVFVFSRASGFRHDSIPAGVGALTKLSAERGWKLFASEDPTQFSEATLAAYDVVVFLSTTGDVLNESQQAAFEKFMRSGKGFVGIHSATDTEYDWPFYGALVGAYFRAHPAVQSARVQVENRAHPATATLPEVWTRSDEWYAFQANPRPKVQVLLSLDESSYAPGDSAMGGDHPIAWCHEYAGARAFYTALGHTNETYAEPLFLDHVAGGIEWAARRR